MRLSPARLRASPSWVPPGTLLAMGIPSAAPREATPVIVAREVSKTFRVPEERRHTLKERVLHPRRRTRYQTFKALNDVSFAVESGEFFGIAGRNGSGKSTLLKCLAGIYGADGQIWRRGRLSTLIELGVGFSMDMAAKRQRRDERDHARAIPAGGPQAI